MYENLNNYKVFYNVAKYKSLSKAAERLYISQPAISKSISKLEEGLEIKLFDRTSKGVMLTEEGEVLYNHIEAAFENIAKGEDEIKKISELGIGQLKIGVSTSLCKHILLDYLKGFITMNPHIKVIIDCHSTINTIKLLQEGKIDIGLICETDIPKNYEYKKLKDIHDIFVASDSYIDNLHLRETEEEKISDNPYFFAGNLTSFISDPEIKNDYKLSIKDILEKSNLMLLEPNNITRTHIDRYLADEDIHPNQILEINNMDLLIDFAAIGMGVASVVREFATDYLESGQIIELPLEKEVEKRTVGFIYPEGKIKQTALEKFLEYCTERK
ncbi:MAG: LysR family transcriptional regulator [Lachnospiraceae bacterium]|nr:LysR family transcriptional regulator [Lachnospiraceae bacterium]